MADELPPLIPPDSVLADPSRRAKLGTAVVHVVELTALLGVVLKVIPHPAAKFFAIGIAGLHKDPETGKVRPTPGTAGNFLPAPFGFLDPEAVGVPKNFYLPPRSTQVIPRAVDRLGLGLPQQRAEDEANAALRAENARRGREQKAGQIASGESNATLTDLIGGVGGFSRSGVIIATSEVPIPELQAAARAELQRRRLASGTQGVGELLASAPETQRFLIPRPVVTTPTTTAPRGILTLASPLPPAPTGNAAPLTTPPTNNQQREAMTRAPELLRELVTERSDP